MRTGFHKKKRKKKGKNELEIFLHQQATDVALTTETRILLIATVLNYTNTRYIQHIILMDMLMVKNSFTHFVKDSPTIPISDCNYEH